MAIETVVAFIIGFIIGGILMMCAIGIVAIQKDKKPQNKVKFIVSNQVSLVLSLFTKHGWYYLCKEEDFKRFNLNPNDFSDMKIGEIREVFLNLEG